MSREVSEGGWRRLPGFKYQYLDVAQMAERVVWDHEAAGSKPVIQTKRSCNVFVNTDGSSLLVRVSKRPNDKTGVRRRRGGHPAGTTPRNKRTATNCETSEDEVEVHDKPNNHRSERTRRNLIEISTDKTRRRNWPTRISRIPQQALQQRR